MIGCTSCSLKKIGLGIAVFMVFLLPIIIEPGNPFSEGKSHTSIKIGPGKELFFDTESGSGNLSKETRSTLIEESFENYDNLDNASTTALLSEGKAMLSRTPAPDSDFMANVDLDWLSDPVHTYPFHPNAMTYDPTIPCLVLSLQGPKVLYRVNMGDGNKLDEIPTINNNNSGIAYNGDYYYYSVGADGDANKPDVYKYQKEQEKTSEYISSKSSKDGYPLTAVGNYIYRGKSYEDGSKDWGKINQLEKVSMAEPDKVLSTYPLGFTGISDLAFDGVYIWVLVNSSDKVSLYQFDTDGNKIEEFKDFYTPTAGLKPSGIAYVEGTGDEDDHLYVLLYKERSGPTNSQLLKITMTSRYTLEDTIYSKIYDFTSDPLNAIKFEATSTSTSSTTIEYFYSIGNGASWEEVTLNEWIDFEEPVDKLSYKIIMSTRNQAITPTLSNLKVVKNEVDIPVPNSPLNNFWANDPNVNFKWTFSDPNDGDVQAAFQIEIAKSDTFGTIDREQTVTSVEKTHTFTDSIKDGAYYWRIRTKDDHGQWSSFSDPLSINVNSVPPVGSVDINDGNHTTDDPNVVLSLSTTEGAFPDVSEMYISNDPATPGTGSAWKNYMEKINWTLEKGLGEKTVHVWFRDENGLPSTVVKASITLEEKAFDIDEGILGWGKIGADSKGKGGIDVFYVALFAVLILLVIVVIFIIKNKGGGDYYDDDYDEDEEEEEDDLDVLEQIRRKRKKEMAVDKKEEKEEKIKEEEEEEEKFESKAQGRYTDLSTDDDFSMGTSRYGVPKEEEKEEEKELTGPYSMKSLEDDFSLEPQRYGGPPSLDDFMKNIEDMSEKPQAREKKGEPASKEKEKMLSKEEAKKAREQIELLKKRRLDILDSLRSTTDSRRHKALEQQMDDIQQLIIELRKHLPDEEEIEEEAPPQEEAEKVEVMDVPSDIKDQLKEGRKRDKKRVGGLGFLDQKEEPEEKTPDQTQMSPEVQARLQQILQQLRVLQQQQLAVQNQMQQTPDPGQQSLLNQQIQVLAQQQQTLQQEAQRLQQQAQPKALPEGKTAVSPEVEAKLAQILQQLQAMGQQKMAIQNLLRQTGDPQMQQTLNQQYQTLSQQQQALQQQAQILQQQTTPQPKPAAAPADTEARARQILQQLQVLAQQQMAIQNQLRQTTDPGQQQALTQQYQSCQQQMEALKGQAATLHQSQPTSPPQNETPPPAPAQQAPPEQSPETEAKLKQILQQLQAIQEQQAAIQNQLSQTQDPGQQQVLSSHYQALQQQAQA